MKNKRCEYECSLNEYAKNGVCTQCPGNCITCADNMLCTSCDYGFVLTPYGECQTSCPKGTYNYNQTCVKCQSKCSNCRDQSTCLECAPGFKLK